MDPEAVDASGPSTGEPRYDPDGIDELLRTIAEHQGAWDAWFARHGITPHRVRYEDLAADPGGVTRGVLDALGLPSAGVPVRPRHSRQADEINAEWIARHRVRA
ncbi:Stf0 family sulfotransferase [Micromonospora sp. CA-244673]|uniref:Stf0 family sulfotransferase n=1 Tax=Micromonospora sp. CA-244673 TaxID=3239958 RepID=UPI003D8BCA1C